MDKFEKRFLETQHLHSLVWCRYIDDSFFMWTHGEEKITVFLNSLNEFNPCIKFTYESDKESIVFLDIKVSLRNGKVFTDLYVQLTDRHQYLHICLLTHTTLKSQLPLAKLCELVGYVVQKRILKIIKKK